MGDQQASVPSFSEWLHVSRALETALAGLTDDDLNLRGGHNGWLILEIVHHLVESHLVTGTIVIAAVGEGGCTFDCSWLNPDQAWMERMAYGRGTVAPGLAAMSAVGRYVVTLLNAAPDALGREIKLLGPPGTDPYAMTVEQMICLELDHARHHLQEIEDMLKQRSR